MALLVLRACFPVHPLRPAISHYNVSRFRFLSSKSGKIGKPSGSRVRADGAPVADMEKYGSGNVPTTNKETSKDEKIVFTELHKEATEAYMAYAMSVLLGRAVPDVRDGLKPVHRRILYSMHELGLISRRPFKKCARVVGEVLGKLHPHGDNAVYDALVRMAQDFSLRYPLIQGHGNFGSIDADPPAAMRYTECRLDALTESVLLADLDFDTVDYVPNFDNSQKEPSVLPSRLPTLLLNGSSGIAVGLATSIPPHNLGEIVDALCALIHNPDAALLELMEYIPGPDFPTGGTIMGAEKILQAYQTGRGSITIRGKTDIELLDAKANRKSIVIKEVPYQVNKASLVKHIAELVEEKKLEGISGIRDESDRSGMRVVIELKKGVEPFIVLNNLYRMTTLQSSFNCNMVGILNGKPQQMGLKEMIQAFIDFRCFVVERRSRFKLSQAQDRKHVIEGILVGLENLEELIRTIREASSNAVASANLSMRFSLSQKQAESILDINLRRLTSYERKKFIDEGQSLKEQISDLEQLLSSRNNLLQIVKEEAIELKDKFSNTRRTKVEDSSSGEVDDLDVIPNDEMFLVLSEKGYVRRVKPDTVTVQNRGTIGKSMGKVRVGDTLSDFVVCHAHDHVLFFSNQGRVYSVFAYKFPESSRTTAGTPLVQVIPLSEDEKITSIIPVNDFSCDHFLVMLTANGYIKKVALNLFEVIRSIGIIAIQLVPGDELKWVNCCTNEDLVAMASQNGMVVLSACDGIRSLGRKTRGFTAMRLKDGEKVACMDIIPAGLYKNLQAASEDINDRKSNSGPWLLFVSENGLGKRVPLSSFKMLPLNRRGLPGYKFSSEDRDRLAGVFVVGFTAEDYESDEHIVLVSQSGTVNRIKVRDISIRARSARGVILMRLEYDGKIQSASLISATDSNSEKSEPATVLNGHGSSPATSMSTKSM